MTTTVEPQAPHTAAEQFALSGAVGETAGMQGASDPSRVELLDARLMTLPTKVIDGVLHYVYGRD